MSEKLFYVKDTFSDDKMFFMLFPTPLMLTSAFFSPANYDPAEDEYSHKNGHVVSIGESLDNNNQPITSQPTRMQRNISINRWD